MAGFPAAPRPAALMEPEAGALDTPLPVSRATGQLRKHPRFWVRA